MKVLNKDIQDAIKDLVVKHKIDDINVVFLCDYLNIKRQTFYYHYQNIYDVIESIFVDDEREFFNFTLDFEEFLLKVKKYIFDNVNFLVAIKESNASDLIKDFYFDIFYNQYVNVNKKTNKNPKQLDLMARYHAGGVSELLLQSLSLYKVKKEESVIDEIISFILNENRN